MKFLSYTKDGRASYGALVDGGVVDLGARHADLVDLREVIRRDRLDALAQEAAESSADCALTRRWA